MVNFLLSGFKVSGIESARSVTGFSPPGFGVGARRAGPRTLSPCLVGHRPAAFRRHASS